MIYNLVKSTFMDMWPLLTIIILSYVIIRFTYLINHKENFKLYKELFYVLGILYILVLYQLVTRGDINYMKGFNLTPFKEILRYDIDSNEFLVNVVGNVLVFLPFGLFLSVYSKPKKMFWVFLASAIVSAGIEFVQLNIGRCFDIDDIILNTLGGILGYFIYKILKKIYRKLPEEFHKDSVKNCFSFIIILVVVLYVLKFLGVINL